MSRLARSHPDDPEMWAAPPVPADVPRRCWCGRTVSQTYGGLFCAEHDSPDDEIKDAS